MHSELQSLRAEEKQYEQQIRQTYKQNPDLFVTHSSDRLNLHIVQKTVNHNTYKCIVANSNFNKFDTITQIRGSIIGYTKLVKIIEEGKVDSSKLPVLLYLNFQQKYLISPKNIAKYLFTNPIYTKAGKQEKVVGNCYIENHFGSKLLTIASQDIQAGQQLILEQQSYERILYKYNPVQF